MDFILSCNLIVKAISAFLTDSSGISQLLRNAETVTCLITHYVTRLKRGLAPTPTLHQLAAQARGRRPRSNAGSTERASADIESAETLIKDRNSRTIRCRETRKKNQSSWRAIPRAREQAGERARPRCSFIVGSEDNCGQTSRWISVGKHFY